MDSGKVLLVDDEEDIRDILGISLSDLGYDVTTAAGGEEALRLFRDLKPPIVLTDIRMPGLDGIALLRKIKQEDPDTEVIMISGHGDMELAIKSLKYEATDFVTKPINDDVLEIALKRARERIAMRAKLREHTENLERLVREKSARLVEAERLLAVGQVVEGFSSAVKDIMESFQEGIAYFNEMPCLVSIYNRDQEVLAVNQLYLERVGNVVGRKRWEIYSYPGDHQENCPVAKTFSLGKGQRSREKIRALNGRELSVITHTAPIRNSSKEVELVLELAAEIEEIHRLQEDLRVTRQRYQQLFDEVPCYISVLDKELRITAANRFFKEDFGDGTGAFCYEIYKHRSEPCPNCPVLKTLESGTRQECESVVTSMAGEQYNVLVRTAPIRNTSGEIVQVMEMSTNITEMRKLQDRLSALGLLMGSISHGVKGLLTGLDGSIYKVDTGFRNNNADRVRDGWDSVKLTLGRVRKMILDLLYYAKERDLSWEEVRIADFSKDVVTVFRQKLGSQPIELLFELDDGLREFQADPGALSSALLNILENAMDACTEGKLKAQPQVAFCVRQSDDDILFDVRDNGVGMNKQQKERLFAPCLSSKGRKGTGLGLFISHEIVRRHGGSIEVDSVPGQGSLFSVRVPKSRPRPRACG